MTAIKAGQKLWLAKHAVADGVIEVTAGWIGENYVRPAGYYSNYRLGRDIFTTEADARIAAEAVRIKRIASLKKQLARLEALSFAKATAGEA